MTYRKKTGQENRGFSLVELIVVILILGILAVIIAPNVISHVAAAQRNVCKNNVVEIENCYNIEQATQSNVTLADIIKDKDKAYFGGKINCPVNGSYVAVISEDGKRRKIVTCTVHSDGVHKVNAQTYSIMEMLLGMTSAERKEYLGIKDNNFSNDTIRRKILDELGGKYESMSDAIQKKMTKAEKMYVKPMITWSSENSGSIKDNEYILFANNQIDDSGSNRWAADAIFNPNTGTWYEYQKPKGSNYYNLASKTYDTIISDIKNNPTQWKALN